MSQIFMASSIFKSSKNRKMFPQQENTYFKKTSMKNINKKDNFILYNIHQ